MLLTIEERSPLFLDQQETTMTNKTRLTALAFAAAALITASMTGAEARPATIAQVAPHVATVPALTPQVMRISPIAVTTTSPAPVHRRPPIPFGDLGGDRGVTGAGGGNAGGMDGVKCESDRDCGIFAN
jgi:hypothetical protein